MEETDNVAFKTAFDEGDEEAKIYIRYVFDNSKKHQKNHSESIPQEKLTKVRHTVKYSTEMFTF